MSKVGIPILGQTWRIFRAWRQHRYHCRYRRIAFDRLYELDDRHLRTLRAIWLGVAPHDPDVILPLWQFGLVTRPWLRGCKGVEVGSKTLGTEEVLWIASLDDYSLKAHFHDAKQQSRRLGTKHGEALLSARLGPTQELQHEWRYWQWRAGRQGPFWREAIRRGIELD